MIVDTHAWMSYFDGESQEVTAIIDDSHIDLKTPSIVYAEVVRKLLQRKQAARVEQVFEFIRKRSVEVGLDSLQAMLGGKTSILEGIPLADSIIYSYASAEDPLLTGDPHFEGKKNVKFIAKR